MYNPIFDIFIAVGLVIVFVWLVFPFMDSIIFYKEHQIKKLWNVEQDIDLIISRLSDSILYDAPQIKYIDQYIHKLSYCYIKPQKETDGFTMSTYDVYEQANEYRNRELQWMRYELGKITDELRDNAVCSVINNFSDINIDTELKNLEIKVSDIINHPEDFCKIKEEDFEAYYNFPKLPEWEK